MAFSRELVSNCLGKGKNIVAIGFIDGDLEALCKKKLMRNRPLLRTTASSRFRRSTAFTQIIGGLEVGKIVVDLNR